VVYPQTVVALMKTSLAQTILVLSVEYSFVETSMNHKRNEEYLNSIPQLFSCSTVWSFCCKDPFVHNLRLEDCKRELTMPKWHLVVLGRGIAKLNLIPLMLHLN
jgi:hypothetical protein